MPEIGLLRYGGSYEIDLRKGIPRPKGSGGHWLLTYLYVRQHMVRSGPWSLFLYRMPVLPLHAAPTLLLLSQFYPGCGTQDPLPLLISDLR